LYARVGASETVAISEPWLGYCSGSPAPACADAEFQGASLDGTKVFFTTTQHLLPKVEGAGESLYEYDFDGPVGGRITLASGGDAAGAGVQRVVGVSEDGSHVYFLAQGDLYVYEHDAVYPQGRVAFIATAGIGTAQVTPDGRFLVFESSADLTPDQEGRLEAGQLFEYDAQTATLVRVSRGQNRYNEDGNSSVYPATIPVQEYPQDLPENEFIGLAVSKDGAYVFFKSEDSLTPQALSGVANVYEYHEGRVALISDGHDLMRVGVEEEPAVELVGTDESGSNVYFRTADRLVPQDTDTQPDIYDARIEGGYPAISTSPSCSEDTCQGPLSGGLQPQVPVTSSSLGEGAVSAISGGPVKASRPPGRPKTKARKRKPRKKRTHKAKRAARRGR